MKTCTKCGSQKGRGSFYRRSVMRDGLNSWCKTCVDKCNATRRSSPKGKAKRSAKRKAFWKNNLELCRARKRRLWWKNPERNRKAQRQKYRKHKKKYLGIMRRYYLDNCERIKKRVQEWERSRSPLQKRLSRRKVCLRRYGMTLKGFESLERRQKSSCAICKITKPGGAGTWHVDHDHQTGKVRKLLCHSCNLGLGNLKDDASLLLMAAEYVRAASTGLHSKGRKGGRIYAHGITINQFNYLLADQRKRCKICRRRDGGRLDRWKVDHDHRTMVIRGILCTNCNFGISRFKDSPSLLVKAAKYIDRHNVSGKEKIA